MFRSCFALLIGNHEAFVGHNLKKTVLTVSVLFNISDTDEQRTTAQKAVMNGADSNNDRATVEPLVGIGVFIVVAPTHRHD